MKRLKSATHHFRKTGIVRNVGNRHAVRLKMPLRPASTENLHASSDEALSKIGKSHLVANANQSSLNLRIHKTPFISGQLCVAKTKPIFSRPIEGTPTKTETILIENQY